MIDIHHHLLWGLDDGPADKEASIALGKAAADDGITHLVCTPHASSRYAFRPDTNRERLAELQDIFGSRLKLELGCDFHLSFDNIQDCFVTPSKYTIDGGRYLLVEFADQDIPPAISDVLYRFLSLGLVPIITHPERNLLFQARPERLAPWLHMGCLIQITAASLRGAFGRRAEESAWEMLGKHWIHFVATDAHDATRRPPCLRDAYERLVARAGADTAQRLCVRNPMAVFENLPLGPQPELQAIDDRETLGKAGGWFGRLFGG